MHNEYNVFAVFGCIKDMFALQMKDGTKPYQMLLMCVAYAPQDSFRKELERLKDHQTLFLLRLDEIVEWYNSFVIVYKPNGTVCLCLDPVRLTQAIRMPAHRVQKSMTHC